MVTIEVGSGGEFRCERMFRPRMQRPLIKDWLDLTSDVFQPSDVRSSRALRKV
jgi:hypothetical protein